MASLTALFLISIGAVQVYLGEMVSRSVALTANGIDCIGDGFVSSIVWFGLRFFHRPADGKFHYGYYKLENLASILAAVVMMLLASYIAYRSYMQLIDPHEVELPALGAGVAFFAGVVALGLGYMKYQESKKFNLASLNLEVLNTIKDAGASFLAVIALIMASQGYPVADAVVGFIISIVIFSIGLAAIKESSLILVDACDTDCNSNASLIVNLANSMEGIDNSKVARLRRSGPIILGELQIELRADMTVAQMAELVAQLRDELEATISNIEDLAITILPADKSGP